MKDRNPPNQPRKEWTPEDRMLWLAAKGAPPEMRLATVDEVVIVQDKLRQALRMEEAVKQTIAQLDSFGYWQTEPNLQNAAAAAAFDGRRFERATTAAILSLERAIEFFSWGYKMPEVDHESDQLVASVKVAITAELAAMRECLAFLKAQSAARRERIA